MDAVWNTFRACELYFGIDCIVVGTAGGRAPIKRGGVDAFQTNVANAIAFEVDCVAGEALRVALENGGAAEEGDGDDCRFHGFVVLVVCDW